MNIFFLDPDPTTCARYHCDKHVVKMILETAQMLCTAHWCTGSKAPYKKTHINHPSTVWARKNIIHYRWLVTLGLELCYEYTKRYSTQTKVKRHKTQDVLEWLQKNEPNLPQLSWQDPPQAMNDEFKRDNVIEGYRNYYCKAKAYMAKWQYSKVPDWFLIE